MRRRFSWSVAVVAMATLVVVLLPGLASAEGTEALAPPTGIAVVDGTGLVAAGAGLGVQPAVVSVEVAAGAAVEQVLLYWEGHHVTGTQGDDTIVVNGSTVTGELIGGPTYFFRSAGVNVDASAYRADITALGVVGPGTNSVSITGADFGYANNGVAVVAIVDDGGNPAVIDLRDGLDLAFVNFPEPRRSTVPQTFGFAPATSDRTAELVLAVASVASANRPNALVFTLGDGTITKLVNPFGSFDGAEMDVLVVPVSIPAGIASLTVEVVSESDGTNRLPASLSWIVAAASIPTEAPADVAGTGTRGYWLNHPEDWPVETVVIGGVSLTKSEALAILSAPTKGDMSLQLASQLIATELNLALGTDATCIAEAAAGAHDLLEIEGIGNRLKASSPAWKVGEPLASRLDLYNNGELCAPARD